MSYSYALPGVRPTSGLARRWMLACLLSQFSCVGAAAFASAIARMAAWPADSHQVIVLNVLLAGVYGASFGYLRGCVLRDKLARFPMLTWCVGIAIVSFFVMPPVGSIVSGVTSASDIESVARALMPTMLMGFGYGILIGVVEAFILRRAAFGLFAWIGMSGVAWACGITAASAVLTWSVQSSLSGTIALTALAFGVQALVIGLVMLPALYALNPQLAYYGPRVYRPLFRRAS